jgi:glycosyltransferase involved in cell wall biosynthesis
VNSISVIIPTYNRAHMLPKTIASLLSQTRLPDEILVIDDGSTDDTPTVMQQFSAPVRYIRYEHNQGRSHARNVGIEQAQGDYLAFLDSDDTLPNDSLALRASYLDTHPDTPIVYGLVTISQNGTQTIMAKNLPTGDIFAHLVCNNFLTIHTAMFRRTCLVIKPRFDENLSILEDWDFWLQLATYFHFERLDSIVAVYFQHTDMTMLAKNEKESLRNTITIQQRIYALPRFATLTTFQHAQAFAWHGLRYAGLGEGKQARMYLIKAIGLAPLSVSIWLLVVRAMRLWWLRH